MAVGSSLRVLMYWAVPWATRRTLPNVKSSATIPRQPSVPNLICWAVIGLKVIGLARALQRVDDLAHVLRAGARNDQKGILGVDDDHVLQADRGHEPPFAEDKAAGRVDKHGLALDRVAVGVGADALTELRPASDVGPVEPRGYEEQILCLLHDGAVDDVVGEPRVELGRALLVAAAPRVDDGPETREACRS